eukprot:5085959-Prymnesium_polylepis.1
MSPCARCAARPSQSPAASVTVCASPLAPSPRQAATASLLGGGGLLLGLVLEVQLLRQGRGAWGAEVSTPPSGGEGNKRSRSVSDALVRR